MEKSIYSEDYTVFLKRLRAARKKAGMTQTQLARRLGQKQPFVSKIERGERRLDIVEVYRICKILKTDFPAFMTRVSTNKKCIGAALNRWHRHFLIHFPNPVTVCITWDLMDARPRNDGKPWTREELILAFELYCRVPFGRITTRNPLIRELAVTLSRTPASVTRKLGNFGAFDPELAARNVSGLTHGSKLDRAIWDEFHRDWNGLVIRAHEIKGELEPSILAEQTMLAPQGPSDRIVTVKQRLHQSFFRDAVLSSYNARCCVTGLPVVECLVAGHIIPWSVDEKRRADPTNGLCLSATFDRLFDCGLMTVEKDLTVCISKRLHEVSDRAVADIIVERHGRKIIPPARFYPDPDCLRWHRENVFTAA